MQDTRINVSLQGPLNKPELKLTSDPPLPQDRLMIMLATGQTWKGTEAAMHEGRLSADLARDFVDFMFFDGSGNRLARRLGISETSFQYDPNRQTVGATATLGERIELQVEADQSLLHGGLQSEAGTQPAASTTEPPTKAYKLGAAYRLDRDTAVSIEHDRRPVEGTRARQSLTTVNGQGPQADDTILFRLRKRF